MALTRADHKRIALNVAQEIKRVLADHNGARLLAKHKAKQAKAPDPMPSQDDEDLEAALGAPEDDIEADGMRMEMPPHLPMKPTKQGFPFSKAGGGMRGRGLKREG